MPETELQGRVNGGHNSLSDHPQPGGGQRGVLVATWPLTSVKQLHVWITKNALKEAERTTRDNQGLQFPDCLPVPRARGWGVRFWAQSFGAGGKNVETRWS